MIPIVIIPIGNRRASAFIYYRSVIRRLVIAISILIRGIYYTCCEGSGVFNFLRAGLFSFRQTLRNPFSYLSVFVISGVCPFFTGYVNFKVYPEKVAW